MTGNSRTIFISDDLEICQLFAYALQRKNIASIVVGSTAEAIEHHRGGGSSLIVINNCADEMDVFTVCTQVREQCDPPLLFLGHRTDELYIARLYEADVDEYIAKPIGMRLFQLKVAAWLRHGAPRPNVSAAQLAEGGFCLDPIHSQLITKYGAVINLTILEFRLLHLLLREPGEIFDSRRILEHVWGTNANEGHTLVKNLVYRIRRKVEADPRRPVYLQTVFGRGYRLQLQEASG